MEWMNKTEMEKLMIIKTVLSTIEDRVHLKEMLKFHLGRMEKYALDYTSNEEFDRSSARYILNKQRIIQLGETVEEYDKQFSNLMVLRKIRGIQN